MRKLFILISILLLTSCKKEEIQKNEFDLRIETNTGVSTIDPYYSILNNGCEVYINNKLVHYGSDTLYQSPPKLDLFFKINKGDIVFVKSGFSSNPKLSVYIDDEVYFSDSCKSTWIWVPNDPGVSNDSVQIPKYCQLVWSKQF